MKIANNTSINSGDSTSNQNTLSINGDPRARSSSVSGLSSNSRLGSTFNLMKQQSIGSQVDLSINDGENITEKDLVKLYDRINEISKDNFLMSIDEIIEELQKDQKDIASILIDRFLSQEWDTRSDDGHSLLTIAIQRGDEDNINYLLGYMKEELTLHDAAKQGKSEPLKIIINFLKKQLKLEREINKKDRHGKTPLHCAAQSGSQECFQLLLTEGARFSDDIYNRSELHFVAQSGNIKCLDYLRDKFKKNGIFQFENEIHKKDKYGNNLLHYAAKSGNKECIERIIGDHIAFIENNNGDTPLHHIASIETIEDKEKHGEAMAFLIEKMAAMLMTDAFFVINQTNRLGYTPLHLAAINDNTACIKVLIERGAKIDAKNVIDGSNALHYAIMYGHSETAKKLLFLNANKNIRHEDDRVLVHLAAMSGNKDCLEFIIEKFPEDINTTDGSDNTLLHLAAQFGNKECLELLAEKMKSKGINLSEEIFKKNNNGETAMHSAALSGNVECLEYLIEIIKQKKYDIKKNIKDVLTQQDENGEVLLHSAVLSGNVECFNLTIKTMEEANINIKDVIRSKNNKKKNLLHLAALSGNKECASVLIELIKKQCNIVDQDLCYLIEKDIDGNSIFHMTAISGNKECIEYFTEKTKLILDINLLYPVDTDEKIISENGYSQTPLHLASMCYNDEVIQFLCDSIKKAGVFKKQINNKDDFGRTPLHWVVMDDSELSDEESEYIISEKRQQNQYLKKKVIKSLLYTKKENGEQVVNEEINFDIKDDNGKTALDYVLSDSDTNIMQLFLDAFYELKEKSEQKYHKLEKKGQERHKWISRGNSILSSIAGIIVTSLILTGMSNSPEKVAASCVAIFCSCVAISLVFLNCYLERKENKLKRKIQSYNEKINQIEKRIEEITGKSNKGYMTERERDELLKQLMRVQYGTEKFDINNRSTQECVEEDIETTDINEQAARGQVGQLICRPICKGKLRRQSHTFLSPRTSVSSSQDTGNRSRTSTFSQVNPTFQDTVGLIGRSITSTPLFQATPTFTFTDHCDTGHYDQVNNTVEVMNTCDSADEGSFRSRTRSDGYQEDLSDCRRKKKITSSITEVHVSSPLSKHPSDVRPFKVSDKRIM